jgi:hypothetical protein
MNISKEVNAFLKFVYLASFALELDSGAFLVASLGNYRPSPSLSRCTKLGDYRLRSCSLHPITRPRAGFSNRARFHCGGDVTMNFTAPEGPHGRLEPRRLGGTP